MQEFLDQAKNEQLVAHVQRAPIQGPVRLAA